jgi:hypothetical protein
MFYNRSVLVSDACDWSMIILLRHWGGDGGGDGGGGAVPHYLQNIIEIDREIFKIGKQILKPTVNF